MTANTDQHGNLPNFSRHNRARSVILTALFFGTFAVNQMPASGHTTQPETGETAVPPVSEDPIALAIENLTNTGGGVTELARLLRDPATAEATLDALGPLVTLPTGLWRDVSRLTTDTQPAPVRAAATIAVARFGTRESVETLAILADDADPQVAGNASRALRNITGLGAGPTPWNGEQWAEWARSAATWTDRAWTRMLLTAQAEAHRQADATNRSLQDATLNLYRRLHVELDATGRSALLAELIGDDRPWLRSLGFDLAGRDLSARTALGEDVASAAAARLRDPDPRTRALAANLIGRLVPPDAMLLFTAALRDEQHPQPAEPMLLGIARWPNADATDSTLRWLERDDTPLDAACTAIWALASRGYLDADANRERTLDRLRSLPLKGIGAPGMRTLVHLGNGTDLSRIGAILGDPEREEREAAADALGESKDGLASLLTARDDPRLFPVIARAITRHDPTPAGFALIAGLPCLEPAVAERALIAHAARLAPGDLASAVRAAALDDKITERALSALMAADTTSSPGAAEGLLLLAQTRLRLGDVSGAGEALVVLADAPLSDALEPERRRAALQVALTEADIEAAFSVEGATPDEWIEALGRLDADDPMLGVISDRLLLTRSEDFSEEQRAVLETWAVANQEAADPDAPDAEPQGETPASVGTAEPGAADQPG